MSGIDVNVLEKRVIHLRIDLPALISAAAILAYWAQVARMVQRARRHHRHTANVVPAERIGRIVRLIWAPAIAIWIVMPWLVAFGMGAKFGVLRPLWHRSILSWAAAAVIVIAWLATRICWKLMGASWRMGIDPAEKTSLVATGPYQQVRHPIYALSQLMMASTIAVAPMPLLVVAALIHFVLMQWEARREEQHLLNAHGAAYRSYLAQVPRFIPGLKR